MTGASDLVKVNREFVGIKPYFGSQKILWICTSREEGGRAWNRGPSEKGGKGPDFGQHHIPSLYPPRLSGMALSRGLPVRVAMIPESWARAHVPGRTPEPGHSFPSVETHWESSVRGMEGLAGPDWPDKCPGLREARPSSERAASPSLPGSQLELGRGQVLAASALGPPLPPGNH